MNILHLSSNLKFGGSEQQLIYLIEALNKKNINSYVFCFDDSILLDYADDIKGSIIAVPNNKAYSKTLLKDLRNSVLEYAIDIIHIHNGKFVLTYMLSDLFYKLPCKCIFSKKDMSTSSSFLSKFKYNYKGIQKITCVTEAIKTRFKQLLYSKNHHKLILVRDGLNLSKLHIDTDKDIHKDFDIPDEKIIVGNVANHVDAKDLLTLVNTLDHLVNEHQVKNIHFLQIGRFTDFTATIKASVKDKGLEPYITFTDFLKEGFKYTSQFNIFLMSSQSEGLPLTILESFYYKIPIVSTKAGGIPEVIIDKENGLLSDIKDHKHLAGNILLLLKDDILRDKIIANAYKLVVETFSAEIMAEQTLSVYNEVLSV